MFLGLTRLKHLNIGSNSQLTNKVMSVITGKFSRTTCIINICLATIGKYMVYTVSAGSAIHSIF